MDSPVPIPISTEDLSLPTALPESLAPFFQLQSWELLTKKAQGGRRTIPCCLCVEASLLCG